MKNIKKIVIISCLIIIILALIFFYFYNKKVYSNLSIKINGDSDLIIKYGVNYDELGAIAMYNDIDISSDIKMESNVDTMHIGNYEVKYSIVYKNRRKSVIRKVKIVDNEKPVIELNDGDVVFLVQGNSYIERGAKAFDNYDGDLSNQIVIDSSEINSDVLGEYIVTYKVIDSNNNESVVIRRVKVVNKPSKNQKIAVLNYHFFYKDYDENCHEALCLNVDTFRKQLQYLRDNDYYTLTIDEFTKWMYGELEVPEKSVLITIDDGAHGTSKINGNHLIPILEEFKMHATLFLVTGWWNIENYESDYLDIQSHTNDLHYEARCGHRSKVNCISYDSLLEDLKKSIDVVKDTNSFCFPFYDYTDESIKAVKELGFKIAFVGGRRKASRSDDKYKIPRYPIYDSTSMDSFINMIS